MRLIQQELKVFNTDMYNVTDSSCDTLNAAHWKKVGSLFEQAEKIHAFTENLDHDHSYGWIRRFHPDPVQDDEETLDATEENEENHWNPVREIKEQFFLRTNPFTVPLISSFDVACIEEFNQDGSPVEKMQVTNPCSPCGVHGMDLKEWCTLCQPPWKLVPRNASQGVLVKKYRKRRASESLDVSENMENDSEEFIMQLISDLKGRKGNKELRQCQICEKKLTTLSSLKSHYLSHMNYKQFPCTICSKVLTRNSGLKYHMQVHHDEYRFTCDVCSKKFRHATHYKNHCQDHKRKKTQCTECPRVFKNRNTFQRHLKTKHGKMPMEIENHKAEKIQCTQCPSVLKNRITLQRHLKTKHGKVLTGIENTSSLDAL